MTLGRTRAIALATAGIRCASVNNDGSPRPPRLAMHGWASVLRQVEAHAGSTRGRVGLIADVSLG